MSSHHDISGNISADTNYFLTQRFTKHYLSPVILLVLLPISHKSNIHPPTTTNVWVKAILGAAELSHGMPHKHINHLLTTPFILCLTFCWFRTEMGKDILLGKFPKNWQKLKIHNCTFMFYDFKGYYLNW